MRQSEYVTRHFGDLVRQARETLAVGTKLLHLFRTNFTFYPLDTLPTRYAKMLLVRQSGLRAVTAEARRTKMDYYLMYRVLLNEAFDAFAAWNAWNVDERDNLDLYLTYSHAVSRMHAWRPDDTDAVAADWNERVAAYTDRKSTRLNSSH